jgi:hypothetical protein
MNPRHDGGSSDSGFRLACHRDGSSERSQRERSQRDQPKAGATIATTNMIQAGSPEPG